VDEDLPEDIVDELLRHACLNHGHGAKGLGLGFATKYLDPIIQGLFYLLLSGPPISVFLSLSVVDVLDCAGAHVECLSLVENLPLAENLIFGENYISHK
jgi:hypothetical protein